jgi:DNA-cytosine methyltransferase
MWSQGVLWIYEVGEMKIRNVLALFDGISCGRVALERAGIEFDTYYASEIDKYAIKIAQKNYPDTVQLGDVKNWGEWDLEDIDLVIGGSPCQGFSFAGRQLNFDDPRSKLFFEFVDVINHFKPKYFLLENVMMKQEFQDIISQHLDVLPIEINSNLVSAQNRRRLYWTNIPNIKKPQDKGILLKDILEDGWVDRDKSHCVDANYFKGGNLKSYFEKHRRQLVFSSDGLCHVGDADLKGHDSIKRVYHPEGKAPSLTTMQGGHREPKVLIANPAKIVGRKINAQGVREDYNKDIETVQYLEVTTSEKSNCLTTLSKDSLISSLEEGKYPEAYKTLRETIDWRKLTPIECERLQTLPDNYTECVSNTQRYKTLGNGWTVDVISHIFANIGQGNKEEWL